MDVVTLALIKGYIGKSLTGQGAVCGQNGADGKDGRDGVDGKDGKDGRDGVTPDLSWTHFDLTRTAILSGGTFDVYACVPLRLVAVRIESVTVQPHNIGDTIATVKWPSGFFSGVGRLRVACAIDHSDGRIDGNLNFMKDGAIWWYDFYANEMSGTVPGGQLYTDEIVRMF